MRLHQENVQFPPGLPRSMPVMLFPYRKQGDGNVLRIATYEYSHDDQLAVAVVSGQSLIPAGCLEERFGVRLAPENFIQDVQEARQPGKRPQPWIASQGSRAVKPL